MKNDPREFANTSDNVENNGAWDDEGRLTNPKDWGRGVDMFDEEDESDWDYSDNERFD